MQSGEGVFADLVIFPKFVDFQSSSLLAIGKPEIFDSITNRPIGAILSINKYIPSISNSQSYFESVIIHQLTHILGFMYDLFDKFTIGFSNVIKTDIETRTNKIKKFIISPKVVAYAKKYFNCENMTGVELEDKGGYDDYNNSHWEARILLGEYMNSEVHTPEQAISGFTLALLEDSGWYETNNYTGGLMRFGKHQGCSFLNEDCELIDSSKNKFKNDLFAVPSIPEILKNTCSSGRQSRCYITINIKSNRGIYIAGKEIADDCFVSDYKREEEDLSYYVGSCSKGNGGYGTIIYYNNDIQRKNGDIPENFGEKISNNSFCVLSSAVPLSLKDENINEYNLYDGITHPMCYPMFCTSRSLTIQIYDHYIVCPREGGIVELKGNYKGYIYCPDYNLICTGTVMCNDMFDCIEKHSLEKDDNFNYDYEIKTSQDKIKDESLTENEITIGYELTNEDSGKCPQFCRQCKENKKCFLCMDNYILIGTKEGDNNPIYCVQNIDLGKYYKNDEDNTYYLCSDNCLSCSAKDHCNSCDSMYKLNSDNSACNEIVPNCKVLDSNNEKCEECKENFYFLDDDKYHCYNESLDKEKFFTEDDGKTYINCSKVIEKCDKCNNRIECLKCDEGYIFNKFNLTCIFEISSCKRYDINNTYCEECDEGYYLLNDDKFHCYNDSLDKEKYFTEDEGKTYISCDKVTDNCEKCLNRNVCLSCKNGYNYSQESSSCIEIISYCNKYDLNYEYCEECKEGFYLLDDDKFHCLNNSLDKDKYFTEDNGKTFKSCDKAIINCENCNNGNNCILCKEGYKQSFDNSSCDDIITFCKKYNNNYDYCIECNDGYYLLDNDRLNCHNESLEPDKYFTEDEGKTYKSCEKAINNCEKCNNGSKCILCKEGFKHSSDNSSCGEIINSCKKYDNNYEYCEECNEGYYLLDDDKLHCYNESLDTDKYFTEDEGKSFLSCDKIINNCIKCNERNSCQFCKQGYKFNKENVSCDEIVSFCNKYDNHFEYCKECINGYYLLNNDKYHCYNNILEKDKYFTEDEGKSYLSCEFVITNCEECQGRKKCILCKTGYIFNDINFTCVEEISSCKKYDKNYDYCEECDEGYYILNDDKHHCYNDSLDKEKYFTEDEGKTYISCDKAIDNCEKCDNWKKCNQCKEYFELQNDGENCVHFDINRQCNITINNIEEDNTIILTEDYIKHLIEKYEKENRHNFGKVEYYTNNNNLTITIFTLDNCTKDLLQKGAYSLNTSNIFEHYIGEKLIICFITYNFKNYISFFQNNKKIDISNELLSYSIENNYTNALNYYYSPLLMEKINEENINIFSLENENLNDKCNSFEIGGIDVPFEIREKIFFNTHSIQEFMCTDMNCEIEENNKNNSISYCICNINNNFNYLFSESKNIDSNDILISEKEFKFYEYMTCMFKNLNTKNLFTNFSFYLSIFCILIEIICFIIFLSCKHTINLKKYMKSNSLKTNNQETQENKNILNTEDKPKQTITERYSDANPPKKILIKYKYKWLNKPKILNIENSHDEDLEIQPRDEANLEDDIKRKIKIFPFYEDNSITDSSYIDESLFETSDKRTENSKNRITIPVGDDKLHIKNNNKIDSPQNNKNPALPQIISREQNARRKIRIHSIKNTNQDTENNVLDKKKEEKIIKNKFQIYCDVVSIKQQLINLFSCSKTIDKESFIPTPMKIIRIIFLILLNLFLNSIFLSQKYFKEKYYYFNNEYNISHEAEKDFRISQSANIEYSLNHSIANILISFIICIIIQLVIGLLFFNTKEKIDGLIEFNKIIQVKNNNVVLKKIKCLFIIYFIINFILVIFFCIFLIGFNTINNNSQIDVLLPSLITFVLLQIIPFLISIIITIIMYFGLKKENKKMISIAKTFLF